MRYLQTFLQHLSSRVGNSLLSSRDRATAINYKPQPFAKLRRKKYARVVYAAVRPIWHAMSKMGEESKTPSETRGTLTCNTGILFPCDYS